MMGESGQQKIAQGMAAKKQKTPGMHHCWLPDDVRHDPIRECMIGPQNSFGAKFTHNPPCGSCSVVEHFPAGILKPGGAIGARLVSRLS